MILSQGFWTLWHMAWGANTNKNRTQHQSTSVLPNQTWQIIPNALMLVHEQKNEIRVNKVILLTLHKVTYSMSLPDSQAKWKHKIHNKKKKKNHQISQTILPLKMLMSHSLKCSYLHYKHWSRTLRKNCKEAEEKSNLLLCIHQRCSAVRDSVCQELRQYQLKKFYIISRIHLFI